MNFLTSVKDYFTEIINGVKAGSKKAVATLIKLICYALIAVISVVLVSSLLAWAAAGDKTEDINFIEATLVLPDGARREYLKGEELTADGLSLQYNGATFDDCQVNADFSTAGIKRVEVYREEGNTHYRAFYNVEVFAIRHVAVESAGNVYADENGEIHVDNPVIKLDLSGEPTEFTVENPAMKSVITLTEDLYTINASPDAENENLIRVNIAFADREHSFMCVRAGGQVYAIDSSRRVLQLVNKDGGDETLTLYVTEKLNSANEAKGIYVYTDAQGRQSVYNFAYKLDGGTSIFKSQEANPAGGVYDRYIGDEVGEEAYKEGFAVAIDNVNFRAEKLTWHRAVLDWDY